MNMAVFWDDAPYYLVVTYRRFRGACSLHHQGDYRNIPQDGHSDIRT
jgi:hypothetical protein